MLTSLEIENFKCFRQLKINPLAKVNLFVGTSNSGKTAVLEAVSLLPGTGAHPKGDINLMLFRNGTSDPLVNNEYAKWLFHDSFLEHEIIISASTGEDSRETQTVLSLITDLTIGSDFSLKCSPPIFVRFVPRKPSRKIGVVTTSKLAAAELARNFDRWTLRAENDDRFVGFLQSVDQRVKSLRAMEHTGQRMLYADVRLPERIALPLLGEGFNRLVQIYGAIIGEGADIVLIDEIENGLHWSALPQIWTGIREAVNKEEVQIFATTHSLECIAAAAEVFKGETKNDLAVHRLERAENGDIHCVTMNEDELERMLERDWEVR
ncbi:MAG: hypothetical protein B7Z37_26100 [Verrucomicrobia bacterium 12-59-8]|nr:MAG: hypothetical protein B7Z37_26100 [Verrucomicrobia bacterium 12-59-8]